MKPTSYSQNMMFEKCPRCWFYTYVKKIPTSQEMHYADAGSIIHKIIENFHNNKKELDMLKKDFDKMWYDKKLHMSPLHNKRDEYWMMIVNAVNLNKKFTSMEMKIFYPDAIGYLDAVNTNEDEIIDWKSSKRSKYNEEDYKKQLTFYSYLYYRKFNRLPKKATVHYLRYNGSKGKLTINPTDKDLLEIEDWHFGIRKRMEEVVKSGKIPNRVDIHNPFCPFPDLCQETDNLNYTLNIQNNYIMVEGPITTKIDKVLNKKFSYELKNAFFIQKHNPNINTTIKYWDLKNRRLPLGFLYGLIKTLNNYAEFKKKKITIKINDKRKESGTKTQMPDKFLNGVKLRDYQEDAVNKFLDKKIGILEVGTGGGKTEISIECIRRLACKTLFVVDKIELLRQTKKRIEDSLGIEVGQIGGGIREEKDITVATIQTLSKHLRQYARYLQSIDFVIFDETHKTAAKSYWRLSHYLINTQYRLGISGTAYRDDGNDMMINAATGYKVYDLNSKILIDKGWLVKPKIIFIKNYMSKNEIILLENKANEGLVNETPNYQNFYLSFISGNSSRNNSIINIIQQCDNKKILVLTKLIEHGEWLNQLIPNSKHLYGNTNKEERKKIFDEFTNGNLNVLISTISIFAEGIDIPQLDMVINASANRGNVKSIQVLGRVLRKLEGKKSAYYIDFIDESKFFKTASLARKRAFIKEGHEIDIIDEEKLFESTHLNIC